MALRSTELERAVSGRLQEDLTAMTVDDSTVPMPPKNTETAALTAEHDRVLQSVVAQLHDVTTRLIALESTIGDDGTATTAGSTSTTPMWRTKNGRLAGWQPTRR